MYPDKDTSAKKGDGDKEAQDGSGSEDDNDDEDVWDALEVVKEAGAFVYRNCGVGVGVVHWNYVRFRAVFA